MGIAAVGLGALAFPMVTVVGQGEQPFPREHLHWALVAPLFPILGLVQPRLPRIAVVGEILGAAFCAWAATLLSAFVLFAEYTRLPAFWALLAAQIAGVVVGGVYAWRR